MLAIKIQKYFKYNIKYINFLYITYNNNIDVCVSKVLSKKLFRRNSNNIFNTYIWWIEYVIEHSYYIQNTVREFNIVTELNSIH